MARLSPACRRVPAQHTPRLDCRTGHAFPFFGLLLLLAPFVGLLLALAIVEAL